MLQPYYQSVGFMYMSVPAVKTLKTPKTTTLKAHKVEMFTRGKNVLWKWCLKIPRMIS